MTGIRGNIKTQVDGNPYFELSFNLKTNIYCILLLPVKIGSIYKYISSSVITFSSVERIQ